MQNRGIKISHYMYENNPYVLMVVYNQIQHDARVIRAAEAISDLGSKVVVVSCNSDLRYDNDKFQSVVFSSPLKGPLLLIRFWLFSICYAIKNKKSIKLLYMHDYNMPFIGLLLSKILSKKWVYDAHELLLQRKGYKYSMRELFFIILERIAIRKADLVISANEERKRIITYIYKLKSSISVSNIAPCSHNSIGINHENTIVYQGRMSEERQISKYINMMVLLPEYVKMKLIGNGPDIDMYKEQVKKLGLENRVTLTGRIPYSKLIEESRVCKIGIVSYLMDDLNNYYCSPNKLYEYVQSGVPVIVSPQPFLVSVVKTYKIGEVWDIDKEGKDSFKEKVIKILENFSTYQENMPQFNKHFNYDSEMLKLKEAITPLVL